MWDTGITNIHTSDNLTAPLLDGGSISRADAGPVNVPLALEKVLTSLPAAGEAAALSCSTIHSNADPSSLCLQSHSTDCSSQDSNHSTCSRRQLSGLHDTPPIASGQWADAHGAVQAAPGLLKKEDLSMQDARASLAGPSAEPGAESMLVLPTSAHAEHSGCNHQTLNPAQQTPEQHPMLPLGGEEDFRQSVSVHQARAGLRAQMADSELHRAEGSSQRPHAQAQSTYTTTAEGETGPAASGDALPVKVS